MNGKGSSQDNSLHSNHQNAAPSACDNSLRSKSFSKFPPLLQKTIAYMFISLLNFHPPQDNSVQSEIMIKLPPLSHKTTACILLSLITCPPSSAPQFPPCLPRLHSNVTLKFYPHLLHKTMAYILKSSKFPFVPHKTIARHSEIMFKLPCRARQ